MCGCGCGLDVVTSCRDKCDPRAEVVEGRKGQERVQLRGQISLNSGIHHFNGACVVL